MKPKLIIVEAPQGGGKTTLTNILRDKIPYTNLLRLSGIQDKSEVGKGKVYTLRYLEYEYILNSAELEINFILDRCHITEKVYCNLGFKDYSFYEENAILNREIKKISELYDVYFILLITNRATYEERLLRDKPQYSNVTFNAENSMLQQKEFMKEFTKLSHDCSKVHSRMIITTDRAPENIAKEALDFINS
jgi:thymidylate kinase